MRGDLFTVLLNSRMGLGQLEEITEDWQESLLGLDSPCWDLTKLGLPMCKATSNPQHLDFVSPCQWNRKPSLHSSQEKCTSHGPSWGILYVMPWSPQFPLPAPFSLSRGEEW